MSEPKWIWGYAAKSPDGELDFITAEFAESVEWELGSGLLEKGWTAVPVEIRERATDTASPAQEGSPAADTAPGASTPPGGGTSP